MKLISEPIDPLQKFNEKNPELLSLALTTLGSFDFSGQFHHLPTFTASPPLLLQVMF